MVALNEQFTLTNPSLGSENRVGYFFCEVEQGVGNNRLAGHFATKGKSSYSYELASGRSNWLSRDPIAENGGINLYAYVGNNPINTWDPDGLARKPGKTPPSTWPSPPKEAVGKKPKWNPEGYWEGKGGKCTWDDRSHGTGHDRGEGPQGGHWDDENSGNRWRPDGSLLPGSEGLALENSSVSGWTVLGLGALTVGAIISPFDGPVGDIAAGSAFVAACAAY